MNINVTLVIQMIVFMTVVWFSMKFIWPMIMQAIEERNKTISEGLAAAEQGQKKLIDAESEANVLVKKARKQASTILDQANSRASSIVEEAWGLSYSTYQMTLLSRTTLLGNTLMLSRS